MLGLLQFITCSYGKALAPSLRELHKTGYSKGRGKSLFGNLGKENDNRNTTRSTWKTLGLKIAL